MAVEFVGIELQLRGYDGVRTDLENLDNLLNSFRGRKKFDAGFDEARKQVVAYKGELDKLQRKQKELEEKASKAGRSLVNATNKAQKAYDTFGKAYKNSSASNVIKRQVEEASAAFDQAKAKLKGNQAAIDSTKNKLRDAQQAVREFAQASRSAGETFMQSFNKISSRVAHVGSAMQSLGNAMVRLTSPFRRLTTGLLMGAGYKAFNLFTEGLGGAFQRADTMKNYDRALKALGLDVKKTFSIAGKEAKTAKDNLDDAVQGLPTSLDEIMAAQKVYAGATGEMVDSTKTAIAANNTFLASGMGSREQRFMQKYLVAMASGAELTTTQWQSMARIAPLAMRAVSKELGYADDAYAQFNKDAQDGTIAGKDFLKAFQKVGISGAVANAARVQTESWNGLFSNIRIAVTRLGANVLETLNQTFKDASGRTLLQRLLGWDAEGKEVGDGIKHWINDISESIQNWIRANPDRIIEFFDNLKSIDFKGLFRGLAEGALEFARLIGAFAKWASNKDLSKLGRWMPRLNIIGNGLLVIGGFLKGTRHIWALLGAGGMRLMGKLPKFGILDRIMSIFGGKKTIDKAKEIPTIASTFRSAFKSLQGMMTVAGGVLIASGTGFVAAKSFKSMINDLGEIINISSEIDWEKGAGAITAMGTFFAAFAGLGKFASMNMGAVGEILAGEVGVGLLTTVAAGIADLDMFFIKDMLKKFKDVTDYLNQSIDNLRNLKNIKDIGDVKERISNVIGALQQVYASLKVQDEEGKSLMAASTQEINAMKDIVGGMSEVLNSIVSINDTMQKLSKIKLIPNGDAVSLGQQIGGIFEGLGEIFSDYLGTDFGENPTEMTAGMTDTITNFNNAFAVLIGENGLFANLRKVQNDLREIPGVQTVGSTLSNLKAWMTGEGGFFANLKDIVTEAGKIGNAGDVETKMGNFANAFESIRLIFKKLKAIKTLTSEKGVGNIPGMAAVRALLVQLESAFETNRINAINSEIQSFIEQFNGLLDAIEKINTRDGKIEITIHLTDKIIGKDTVLSDIAKLALDIQSAINKIKTYYSKSITIDINGKTRTSGIYDSSLNGSGYHEAKGGLIYRARGGRVPWKRRGTDTVPAMLTPGEYVHNKRAVSAFGIDFMRKVNNLDMRGAMDELMHRAGHMANINRGTTITNNNYNNQKVVINNNGSAGAGYTFKSASRFVGAF